MDEYLDDLGYRSRAEIVNDAIRRFIDEKKRLEQSTETGAEATRRDLTADKVVKLRH